MGNIMKFDIGRLEPRRFELRLDCPNCGSARITFSAGNGNGHVEDIICPKCGIRIILDGLNITVMNDSAAPTAESDTPHLAQGKGSIL